MSNIENLKKMLKEAEQEKRQLEKELAQKEKLINFIVDLIHKEYEKQEQEMKEVKNPKMTIEDKIKEVEAKGFEVKRNRTWLWITGSKHLYDEKKKVNADGLGVIEVIDRSKEDKVLKELGFQYSTNRMQWYYIHE